MKQNSSNGDQLELKAETQNCSFPIFHLSHMVKCMKCMNYVLSQYLRDEPVSGLTYPRGTAHRLAIVINISL